MFVRFIQTVDLWYALRMRVCVCVETEVAVPNVWRCPILVWAGSRCSMHIAVDLRC